MTEKAKLYFDKFIKYGFNHTDFTEKSVQKREIRIFPELLAIEHKLPNQLRGQRRLILLARELSEIAIVVQGFAIHYFKLSPSKEMIIQDTQRTMTNMLFDNVRHNSISTFATNPETDRLIVSLRNMLHGKDYKIKIAQTAMNLIVGQNRIPVPKDIKYRFIRTLLYCLESHKRSKRWDVCEQRKSLRNELFYLVEQKVCNYFRTGFLNKNEISDLPSKLAAPIAAIVFMAAGYIRTVDDYKIGNKEKAGKPKYHSYGELIHMQLSQAKMKHAPDILSFDLPLN